ncbi:hypothetical protein PMAYCL1PPCAC_29198 [Pristionchus mayeri]|uniref:Cap-specific mRNA (nucleoside-2'-O-)-methyltransferase 1 n=1 Tax=Pristionchus mayeri TaxID=1317129 RepID=A0AAN5D9G4_9BILA|nr:hypothetical protein PMAYCL1PPCAC_29198 [Pristionchus mayeri]
MAADRGSGIEVTPNWLIASEESREEVLSAIERGKWQAEIRLMPEGEPSLGDEKIWCDGKAFHQLCEVKTILNKHESQDIEKVRQRSNPHEPLLKNKAMMGRMSLLIASIDRVFDFLLTDENIEDAEMKLPLDVSRKGTNIDRERELFYFAETQSMNIPFASQYVLIRKGFYNAKCFIPRSIESSSPLLSLALVDSMRRDRTISDVSFDPYTSSMRRDFTRLVARGTRDEGVNFYAGFTHNRKNLSISNKDQNRGDQGQKELLFRDSYVGQLFYASSIVREGGKAILQFLDTNTSTTVGVLYLLYIIFDRVSIYKPNLSRPANAEKFIICDGLRPKEAKVVHRYAKETLEAINPDETIRRLIPDRVIETDHNFLEYFTTANNCLAERQHKFLRCYLRMLDDEWRENTHQKNCLGTCLPYYLVPYVDAASRKSLWKVKKEEGAEVMISSILPRRIEMQDLHRRLTSPPSPIHSNQLLPKLNNQDGFVMTPCADISSTLVVSTWNGIYYLDRGGFIEWSRHPCILPPQTILLGDFFEFNGGRSQVLRVLDVGLIFGDDVSTLPFKKRLLAAHKLIESSRKDGVKPRIIFTMANYERVEKGWKPDSTPSLVVERPFRFEKAKFRFVKEDSRSFFDLCMGEGGWEMR